VKPCVAVEQFEFPITIDAAPEAQFEVPNKKETTGAVDLLPDPMFTPSEPPIVEHAPIKTPVPVIELTSKSPIVT
jgi:hypothetical protein